MQRGMARFEPEGFVLTLDPARVAALLRELQNRDLEPITGENSVEEDAPTVRLQCIREYV